MNKSTCIRKIYIGLVVFMMTVMLFPSLNVRGEEDDDDETYWEHVHNVQSDIQTNKTLKYGMIPIYGCDVNDGEYEIEAKSNSSYFHMQDAVLKVEQGHMTARFTIPSMSYMYVYMGMASEAKAASREEWIDFVQKDGQTVFEVPVEALDKEIDCAAYSKSRKKWYNRKIVFYADSLPEPALKITIPDYDLIEDAIRAYGQDTETVMPEHYDEDSAIQYEPDDYNEEINSFNEEPLPVRVSWPDGEYSIEVNMIGGSGRASISSPTLLIVKDGLAYARLLWSSSYYDYVRVGNKTFYNITTDGGNSVFEIPIVIMDDGMPIIADTTAMGEPVEIYYELTFYYDSISGKGAIPQEAAKRVLIIAGCIIVFGGMIHYFIVRKRLK